MDGLSIDLNLNHDGFGESSSLIFDSQLGRTFDGEHALRINHTFLITTFLDLGSLTRDPCHPEHQRNIVGELFIGELISSIVSQDASGRQDLIDHPLWVEVIAENFLVCQIKDKIQLIELDAVPKHRGLDVNSIILLDAIRSISIIDGLKLFSKSHVEPIHGRPVPSVVFFNC